LRGDEGLRSIPLGTGVDRKTARRYVEAATALGLERAGGADQLTDELIGSVCDSFMVWIRNDLTLLVVMPRAHRDSLRIRRPPGSSEQRCEPPSHGRRLGAGRRGDAVRPDLPGVDPG